MGCNALLLTSGLASCGVYVRGKFCGNFVSSFSMRISSLSQWICAVEKLFFLDKYQNKPSKYKSRKIYQADYPICGSKIG